MDLPSNSPFSLLTQLAHVAISWAFPMRREYKGSSYLGNTKWTPGRSRALRLTWIADYKGGSQFVGEQVRVGSMEDGLKCTTVEHLSLLQLLLRCTLPVSRPLPLPLPPGLLRRRRPRVLASPPAPLLYCVHGSCL